MSAVTRPRGPLPARVYWTRRLVIVAVAFAMVFGVARLLGGGGSGNQPSAQTVGAESSRSAAPSTPTSSPTSSAPAEIATAPTVSSSPSPTADTKKKKQQKATPSATALPASAGPCRASDVVVTPTLKRQAYAGKPVVFALEISTVSSPACDFTVSAHDLVLKISSGVDRIWSTQQCSGAVPKQDVVARKDTPAVVPLAWNGQRSDADCSRSTAWAEPGYYHAVAAAYGADPVDKQFKLAKPKRPRVTEKPSPTASPKAEKSRDAKPAKKKNQKQKQDSKPQR